MGVNDLQMSDVEFFEEYKRLDRLCADMFSCQNGVSAYIEQMESEAFQGRRHVPAWDADYKMLKHVRWVRNQIAHDSGGYLMSGPKDLQDVLEYRQRILLGTDALALLKKATREDSTEKGQQKPIPLDFGETPPPPVPGASGDVFRTCVGVLIGIGILAVLMLLANY
jgi:hypothetical protein